MAEQWREHIGSDIGELHDACNDDIAERNDVRRGGDQYGGDGDKRNGDADGECSGGGTDDHDATSEPDGYGRADGYIRGGGRRDSATELPVAEERREHIGSDRGKLHDACNDDIAERNDVRRGGDQYGGDGDEWNGDTDRECSCSSTDDRDTAGEPDGDGRTDSNVRSSSGRDGATELPMAEQWREHIGSDIGKLHHAGDDNIK